MVIYLVNNVINEVNLIKIGQFWGKWSKLGHFGGKKDVVGLNFGMGRKYFFLKTFSKVRFINLTVIKNVIKGFNLVNIAHFKSKHLIFWWKWSKLGYFWGKNEVISQNLWKVVKKFSSKFLKIISVRFVDINLVKNVINWVNSVKIGHFLSKCAK